MTAKKTKKQKAYDRGLWAESLAAMFLMLKGCRILERRYKTPVGEIDLIAKRGKTLLMVEVKARAGLDEALEAVDLKTQKRIEKATLIFLSKHPHYVDYTIRFDVIALTRPFRFRHLDNAWQARS
ncbi:MAG: UPF0102 protein [Micavibrio sp.]|nr:MAG: UPF0102 protein [Micavibrio sp.]